jgi:hypothetical protein
MLTTKRLLSYSFRGKNTKSESTREFVERVMQSLNLHQIEPSKQMELVAETCLHELQ